ncbi:MAG TPA: DUF2177 family protein [Acidobacteriota bacterium]|nr:DUF2177 family protein [Acidobacteriota bacterium]
MVQLSILVAGIAAAVTIFVLDFVFLGILAKSFYIEKLSLVGRIANGSFVPVVWAAVIVYLLLAAGATWIAVATKQPILISAFFGLIVYGVYEFTNYSLLKNWPLSVVFVDLAWGIFVCTVAGFVANKVLVSFA